MPGSWTVTGDVIALSLYPDAVIPTLLEQTLIRVGPDAFDAFLARLDAPPQPNERLRKTMQTPPPWEKE